MEETSTDFHVVPKALLDMVGDLASAATHWNNFTKRVDNLVMASLDLGLLGEEANYPDSYNSVKDTVADKLSEGHEVLISTGETLAEVAKVYKDKDAEYYKEFGYLESDMD